MAHTTPTANTTLADRALIRLSGSGVRDFLQGLVTNDVSGALPVWAGLLTPQGKALFDFIIWAEGDDLLIDCEAEQVDALTRRLTLYRLRKPITIVRDDNLAVHWSSDGAQGVPDPRLGALGRRWLAPPDGPAQGWHSYRRALGVPEGVGELGSDRHLWLECNADLLNGVSFTKGCYVGQEIIARMESRGRLAKVLRGLKLTTNDEGRKTNDAESDPLVFGLSSFVAPIKLEVDGKEAGDLTSVVVSPRFGPIGLAYVRSAHAAPGGSVGIAGAQVRGEVVELPFDA